MNKRKRRLSLQAVLLYILLCTIAVAGVTFSKYTAESSGSDSARVIKMGDVTIEETPKKGGKLLIAPGLNVEKSASVSFEGSEAACYLFVTVTAKGWTTEDEFTFTALDENLSWSVQGDWTYLETDAGEDGSHIYVYYTVLPANEIVTGKQIVEKISGSEVRGITVSPELTHSKLQGASELSMLFGAAVVQYDGFGEGLPAGYTAEDHAKAAWASLSRQ